MGVAVDVDEPRTGVKGVELGDSGAVWWRLEDHLPPTRFPCDDLEQVAVTALPALSVFVVREKEEPVEPLGVFGGELERSDDVGGALVSVQGHIVFSGEIPVPGHAVEFIHGACTPCDEAEKGQQAP